MNGTHVRLVDVSDGQITETTANRNPVTGSVVITPSRANRSESIAIDGPTYASLAITFTKPNGERITYRQGVAIDANNETVRILWPGPTKVCQGQIRCGQKGIYVPGGEYPDGVSMNTTVRTRASEYRSR